MTTAVDDGAVVGEDGVARCPWGAHDPLLREYHDTEWGHVLHGRDALYERLCLEAFQSGLSWLVILRKRPAFRAAFARFDVDAVAGFGDDDVERLLADAGIVRNRSKIEAAVSNARAVLRLEEEGPGLDALLWSHAPDPPAPAPRTLGDVNATTPASVAMAKELRRRGFRFVGPTTAHALMQATGMVDEHLAGCFRATR
ncbi:DNA-3-methyladenine glycosylase I [Actinomycetospora termitidis]|uniref:DNA-3-methyladenine glycosylase I n=1 Tax=Actinomycetospora termitidis TaxID=3053470 RepID=A0ABT7MA56_9PSEU|nr:DNA-3-methyladenine glycosylase I [Actinomycetospora sp. Odt1-22]MDL5157346.1 DNA-3-methyladenine glycosylase I [Actinomycetospora sp. Odt1-22]